MNSAPHIGFGRTPSYGKGVARKAGAGMRLSVICGLIPLGCFITSSPGQEIKPEVRGDFFPTALKCPSSRTGSLILYYHNPKLKLTSEITLEFDGGHATIATLTGINAGGTRQVLNYIDMTNPLSPSNKKFATESIPYAERVFEGICFGSAEARSSYVNALTANRSRLGLK